MPNKREEAVHHIRENSRKLLQLKKEEVDKRDSKWELREKNGRTFILHTTGHNGIDGFQMFYPEEGNLIEDSLTNFNNY